MPHGIPQSHAAMIFLGFLPIGALYSVGGLALILNTVRSPLWISVFCQDCDHGVRCNEAGFPCLAFPL